MLWNEVQLGEYQARSYQGVFFYMSHEGTIKVATETRRVFLSHDSDSPSWTCGSAAGALLRVASRHNEFAFVLAPEAYRDPKYALPLRKAFLRSLIESSMFEQKFIIYASRAVVKTTADPASRKRKSPRIEKEKGTTEVNFTAHPNKPNEERGLGLSKTAEHLLSALKVSKKDWVLPQKGAWYYYDIWKYIPTLDAKFVCFFLLTSFVPALINSPSPTITAARSPALARTTQTRPRGFQKDGNIFAAAAQYRVDKARDPFSAQQAPRRLQGLRLKPGKS
ncbi:hypothetical protein BJ875DRAFT_443443 [Amylocarpus encephaloides]|uniref:Uncharacterized protein n=1 Tax=Amylocarpus encephaloides TaxID=45428 RepID=A0A9P7YEC1_9HELO|nr:hypothetical protein BJ875DRAFT_443443 [Amylocarpus encephaloides]